MGLSPVESVPRMSPKRKMDFFVVCLLWEKKTDLLSMLRGGSRLSGTEYPPLAAFG